MREHVRPETKIVLAGLIEDPWMLQVHLADLLDVSATSDAFYHLGDEPRAVDWYALDRFCDGGRPVVFLYRANVPTAAIRTVIEQCGVTESVDIDWPKGVIRSPEWEFRLLKQTD